ncbi:MAG: tetratricopeptide repeat protein, partial [Desulfohalobiaceae bacterium]
QGALKAADTILASKPNSAAALMVKGDAYRGMNRTDQAAAEYVRAHECAQMYLEPLKRLAALYEELGDDEKQLSFLDKLDELSPLNVARKMRIGGLHMAMGDEEKGKQSYALAMEVATREAAQNASNVAMDIAERLLGVDAEAAETFYRKALSLKGRHLDRSDVETFNRLGIALRRQKRPKAAITEYTRALALAPDDENLYYNVAMAYLEAGDYQLARSRVEKVLQLNRSFARHSQVLSYNVGMIYYKSGDADTGSAYFEQSLELDPGYRPARQMLEKIAQG